MGPEKIDMRRNPAVRGDNGWGYGFVMRGREGGLGGKEGWG